MDDETGELHEFDELLRFFGSLRREIGEQFPAPRAAALSAFLAVMSESMASFLTTEVGGRPPSLLA